MKDLSFCAKVPIPGYYSEKGKRFGLRKAKTYKGKPHESHIRVFKKKHADKQRKCKCFICGAEGHSARDCSKRTGNIARAAIMENLDIPDDYDVLSVDLNEADSDAICSLSEGEVGNASYNVLAGDPSINEMAFVFIEEPIDLGWRKRIEIPKEKKECDHDLIINQQCKEEQCDFCKIITRENMRGHCQKCSLTTCPMCSRFYLKTRIEPVPTIAKEFIGASPLIKELMSYNLHLISEHERLQKALTEKLI